MLKAFFDKTFPFSCPLLERGQIIKSHELSEIVASSSSASSIERASCRRKIKLEKVRFDKSDKDTDHVLDVKVRGGHQKIAILVSTTTTKYSCLV